MSKKTKKVLLFTGLGLDVVVTTFLFVIAIIMLATMPTNDLEFKQAVEVNGPFIGYLQQNYNLYLCVCVIPLFVLLAGNIAILVIYVKKAGKAKTQLSDLSEEQKAALRAELLKEMDKSKEEDK